jgi:hypothetical protein
VLFGKPTQYIAVRNSKRCLQFFAGQAIKRIFPAYFFLADNNTRFDIIQQCGVNCCERFIQLIAGELATDDDKRDRITY